MLHTPVDIMSFKITGQLYMMWDQTEQEQVNLAADQTLVSVSFGLGGSQGNFGPEYSRNFQCSFLGHVSCQ